MNPPDHFLLLWPIGDNWVADVMFVGGRAGGIGATQLEAMEAALDDIDLIRMDLEAKRGMLEALIRRTEKI